jgi:FtsH-binding integral membrane protein
MQPNYEALTRSNQIGITRSTNKVLRNTYILLAISLIPTVIGAVAGVRLNLLGALAGSPIMAAVVFLAGAFGLMFLISKFRDSAAGVGLLLVFTLFLGLFLAPLLQVSLGLRNGAQLITMAAGGTAVIFFGLAGYATATGKDFSFMGKFLAVGVMVVFLAAIANVFFQVPALSLTISAVAVFVFSMFILYDVSRIVNGGETNYIMATLSLYLNIYNIFTSLLQLLMAFSSDD